MTVEEFSCLVLSLDSGNSKRSEWEVQVTDSDRWSSIQQQLPEGALKKQRLGDSEGEELAFNRKRPPSEVGSERGSNLLMR